MAFKEIPAAVALSFLHFSPDLLGLFLRERDLTGNATIFPLDFFKRIGFPRAFFPRFPTPSFSLDSPRDPVRAAATSLEVFFFAVLISYFPFASLTECR